MDITDDDRAEVAKRIEEGYTSGFIDSESARLKWDINMDKVCRYCLGTGEVSTMEAVDPSEPWNVAPVGSEPCKNCQHNNIKQ